MSSWDKKLAEKLRKMPLSNDQVGEILGCMAEHHCLIDRNAYERGFNDGYDKGFAKANTLLTAEISKLESEIEQLDKTVDSMT